MALHCPATLLVATPGGLTDVRRLAESLRPENLIEVVSSPSPDAVACAEAAARVLDLPTDVVTGLAEVAPGEGESALLTRCRDALAELADTHRGESVLVLSHPRIMTLALLALADTVPPGARSARDLPALVPARVEVDPDGVRVLTWPGRALPAAAPPPDSR